jgi:septum formation protein
MILASTSPYRQTMLKRLHLPFETVAPRVDETPLTGEAPKALALRLARAKARAVALRMPGRVVLGADQVATADHQSIIGKPGSHERAVAQLQHLSGREVTYHSAMCVTDGDRYELVNIVTLCRFRTLSAPEIEAYLRIDSPYDTAGSAKAESLGITLMDSMYSEDPTAIIGLPLIALARLLRSFGLNSLIGSTR